MILTPRTEEAWRLRRSAGARDHCVSYDFATSLELALCHCASMLGMTDAMIEGCRTVDQLRRAMEVIIAGKVEHQAHCFIRIEDFKRALEASYQMHGHAIKCQTCMAAFIAGGTPCEEYRKLLIDAVSKRDIAMKICS